MWTCPRCGSEVDTSFDICWACGTSADGVEDPSFLTADEAGPIGSSRRVVAEMSDAGDELELPEPPLELVECYRPRDSGEAHFLVERMAEAGIPAAINGANMGNTEIPLGLFAPRVMVRADDFGRSRAFVEDYEKRRRARVTDRSATARSTSRADD